MSQHQFRQLSLLREKILHVGATVESALSKAVLAVVNRDAQMAASVVDQDDIIDQLEVEVEEECLKTLALHQPVAADLRLVVSILKINNDLERMGDLARNIAKRGVYLAQQPPSEFAGEIRAMASKVQSMVKRCLDSLIEQDTAKARKVRDDDDEVDAINKHVQTMVRGRLHDAPHDIETALKWSAVSKNLERIADMATHIAEDVIYMVEGDIVRNRADD